MTETYTYRERTPEELRDALSRFCQNKSVMSIPVDLERDADIILSDGIKELIARRDEVRRLKAELAAERTLCSHNQPPTGAPTAAVTFTACTVCGRTDSVSGTGTQTNQGFIWTDPPKCPACRQQGRITTG